MTAVRYLFSFIPTSPADKRPVSLDEYPYHLEYVTNDSLVYTLFHAACTISSSFSSDVYNYVVIANRDIGRTLGVQFDEGSNDLKISARQHRKAAPWMVIGVIRIQVDRLAS